MVSVGGYNSFQPSKFKKSFSNTGKCEKKYLLDIKLNNLNWWTWYPLMEELLLFNDLWDWIQSTNNWDDDVKESGSSSLQSAEGFNRLVVHILRSNCENKLKFLLNGVTNAYDAWKILEANAEKHRGEVRGTLLSSLRDFSWKTNGETYEEFCIRLMDALSVAYRLNVRIDRIIIKDILLKDIPNVHRVYVNSLLNKLDDDDTEPSCIPGFLLDEIEMLPTSFNSSSKLTDCYCSKCSGY